MSSKYNTNDKLPIVLESLSLWTIGSEKRQWLLVGGSGNSIEWGVAGVGPFLQADSLHWRATNQSRTKTLSAIP